jgi:hypothetical protein
MSILRTVILFSVGFGYLLGFIVYLVTDYLIPSVKRYINKVKESHKEVRELTLAEYEELSENGWVE